MKSKKKMHNCTGELYWVLALCKSLPQGCNQYGVEQDRFSGAECQY